MISQLPMSVAITHMFLTSLQSAEKLQIHWYMPLTFMVSISVATVMTDAKQISQNCENICGDKPHQKPGVIFYPKRIGWLFPTLWSGHEFGHKFG